MRAGSSATSRARARQRRHHHPRPPRPPCRRPRRAAAADPQRTSMTFERIAVVGAGAWGCALANLIARAGHSVLLAARDRAGADVLVNRRESPRLPGLRLHDHVGIAPLSEDVGRYDAILLAVPSQHLRDAATVIAPTLARGTPVIACAKGIERGTHKFMTEVIAECARAARPAILSGPSFAEDVARGLPAAVTLAARDDKLSVALAHLLG